MEDFEILTTLEKRFEELTKTQKIVADYIIKNPMNAAFSTVDQLAQTVGVSTTTIVRMALFLGCHGYADFQRKLQVNLQEKMAPSNRLEENFHNLSQKNGVLSEIFRIQMENLRSTFDGLTEAVISNASHIISNARKTYVIGSRSCYGVAHHLSYNLNRVLGNCDFLNPSDCLFAETVNRIRDQDVLIAISLPRYINQVVFAARIAHSRGAKVIAITDGYLSPLAQYSNILLRTECNSYDFHNSVLSAMLISEILISIVTSENPLSAKKNLDETEEILDSMNVHVK